MKLIIAEKEYMAQDIAHYLSKKNNVLVENIGKYFIAGDFFITWARGHLLKYYEPQDYNKKYSKWNAKDLPIIPLSFEVKIITNKEKRGRSWVETENTFMTEQIACISDLISKSKEVYHAGDADREGQMIVDEILNFVNNDKPVSRLWLHGLSDSQIDKAFHNLTPNETKTPLFEAAKARAETDWLYGTNFSRAITMKFKEKGLTNTFQVGRVQTPLLFLLFQREQEIKNFTPLHYYDIELSTNINDLKISYKIPINAGDGFIKDGFIVSNMFAESILEEIKSSPELMVVKEFPFKNKISVAPLFNLSLLQQECNSLPSLGIGVAEAATIAQTLYEYKLISYPRTNCCYLSSSAWEECLTVLNLLNTKFIIPETLSKRYIFNDSKVNEHHAIIPLELNSNIDKLTPIEHKVYNLIVNRFIENFLPESFEEMVKLKLISKNKPKLVFNAVVDLLTLKEIKESKSLFIMEQKIVEKQTEKPKHFTEGGLINAMINIHNHIKNTPNDLIHLQKILLDGSGLGTEATRANIIEGLKNNSLIRNIFGTNLVQITDKGQELINAIASCGVNEILSPLTTAIFESRFSDIVNSPEEKETVRKEVEAFIEAKTKQILDSKILLTTNFYKNATGSE